MSTYAKAPWKWVKGRTQQHLHDSAGNCFAEVSMPIPEKMRHKDENGMQERYEASARIIVAAPETWEMLNEVVNGGYLDRSPEQKQRVVDFLQAKSEGR